MLRMEVMRIALHTCTKTSQALRKRVTALEQMNRSSSMHSKLEPHKTQYQMTAASQLRWLLPIGFMFPFMQDTRITIVNKQHSELIANTVHVGEILDIYNNAHRGAMNAKD